MAFYPRNTWFFLALLALVTTGMLVAGLDPKDFRFRNEVAWMEEGPGIRFGQYGAAVGETPLTKEASGRLARTGFTIELALERNRHPGPGFGFIAVLHNGDDSSQLLVGQWRETVIVMSGDDYDYSRKQPRLGIKLPESPSPEVMLTVTSGEGGTGIYLDGELIRTHGKWRLRLPAGGRWILGNSVYGTNGWRGGILGFALYDRTLTSEEISRNYRRWKDGGEFSFATANDPLRLYVFDEQGGSRVRDRAGKADLEIPSRGTWLRRELLGLRFHQLSLHRSDMKDYLLNLFGFMPFGLLCAIIAIKLGLGPRWAALAPAGVLGLVLSFAIEYAQSWMPSRSSSALDLVLNTAGALLGALVYLIVDSTGRRRTR